MRCVYDIVVMIIWCPFRWWLKNFLLREIKKKKGKEKDIYIPRSKAYLIWKWLDEHKVFFANTLNTFSIPLNKR